LEGEPKSPSTFMLTVPISPLTTKQKIINDAINEVVAENPGLQNDLIALVSKANDRVVFKMIDYFPRMCADAREINQVKYKMFKDYGNKGKFTDTYGWSNDGTMLFEYDIPPDLFHFMRTAVYSGFWEKDNDKIWRRFMDKICRRTQPLTDYEAQELLIKIKAYYGPNSDRSLN